MTEKLKHGEEFTKSFKDVMQTHKDTSIEHQASFEKYKDEMLDKFVESRREMEHALETHKIELSKTRAIINKQMAINVKTENHFDMYQGIVAESVADIKKKKDDLELEL